MCLIYTQLDVKRRLHLNLSTSVCVVQVFYEEELDVPLVLFNEVLDHVLRIDRIFRQPQGHLLLIGVSGAGKTTLSRYEINSLQKWLRLSAAETMEKLTLVKL